MSAAMEANLHNLLPTLTYLPPELLALSISLLAQSRSKAPTLKPEEEIARTYVCCHIACERLGRRLGLEIARPKPPLKPKVYERLKGYFGSVLATPRKGRGGGEWERGLTGTRVNESAQGQAVAAVVAAPAPNAGRKRAAAANSSDVKGDTGLPAWVMPMIRHLCRALGTEESIPHVFAGTEMDMRGCGDPEPVVKRRKTSDSWNDRVAWRIERDDYTPADRDVAALNTLATVYAAVTERMYDKEHAPLPDDVVDAIHKFCSTQSKRLPLTTDSIDFLRSNISEFLCTAMERWQGEEWYNNVPTRASLDSVTPDEAVTTPARKAAKTPLRRKDKRGKLGEETDVGAAGLLPGLGTMFQPAVDWLSEQRRAEYAEWKEDILRQVAVRTR